MSNNMINVADLGLSPSVKVPDREITMESSIDMARLDFVRSVNEIPGITVEVVGTGTLADQSIRVIVPDVLGPIADQVYALLVRIRRQYRHAKLNIEVEQIEVE